MTWVLVGFSRSLLALMHSLMSWTWTAKLRTAIRASLTDTLIIINLAVVGVLVDVQLFKLSSVQKVQQRPQHGALLNTDQKQLLAGQLTTECDSLQPVGQE